MKSSNFFLTIIVLCLLLIPIVSAETLTGTLGGINLTQYNYGAAPGGAGTSGANMFKKISAKNIQYVTGVTALIHFDDPGHPATFDVGWLGSGETTTFTASIGAATLGAGTFGYMRNFVGFPATEIAGYQFYVFDSWDPYAFSGDKLINITMNINNLHNISYNWYNSAITGSPPTGYLYNSPDGILLGATAGQFLETTSINFINTYSAIKPSGIGITGSIIKNNGGMNYTSRVYVSNATSNIVLTSDNTVNTNTFNFSTTAQSIFISVQDSTGGWHNTSTLFTVGVPTPIPTQNPYYTGSMNMTFYVKNAVNNTNIANAYVDYHYNPALSGNPSTQGYTDANGAITFQLVDIANNQKVDVYKTGYQHAADTFTPTGQSEMFKIVPMYTDVPGGNPSTPATINITMRVKDVNGNTPISGAYVSARDTIVGISERSQTTNSTGYVYFPNFPNTAYIDGIISKSNYLQYHWFSDGLSSEANVYLERYLTPSNIVTIPTTIPPAQYDTWTLGATPNAIILGSSSSLLLACSNATKQSYPTLQTVLFYENTNLGAYTQPTLVGAYHYNVSATKWNFQFKNGTWDYTTVGYTPLSLSVTPGTTGSYTYSATAIGAGNWPYTTGTTLGSAQTNLLISGPGISGTLTMNLAARDGSSGAHLQNYTLTLTDRITNQVVTYNVDYDININLPRGSPFTLAGSKTDYISGSINFNVPIDPSIVKGSFGASVYVNLFPPGTISAGNTTVAVHVSDQETYYPVPNVQISMSNILDPKFTSQDGGSVSFILPQDTLFVVTAHKEGYCDVSESKNTTNKDYMYVDMYIKYGSCSGPVPTHTQIPGANGTPTTTPTLIGGYGQQNGAAAVCNQLPVNATLVDQLRNQLACNGLKDIVSQNLGLAVGIILLCGMIAASKAKGIGFAIGAGVGTVASMALGLIAFWIVLVIVIIIIGIMVLLAARSGGG